MDAVTSYNRRLARHLRDRACTTGDLVLVTERLRQREGSDRSFDFTFEGRGHRLLNLLGARRRNCHLRVADARLEVDYGPWRFTTPLANIADVTTSPKRVQIDFREPVHGHELVGVRHRSLTVAVDDPDVLVDALHPRE